MVTIGERLREIRENAGMTRVDLELASSVTAQTISGYETGLYVPWLKLEMLLKALGYRIEIVKERRREGMNGQCSLCRAPDNAADEIERLREALQAIVDAYPVASGVAFDEPGYGAIGAARRLLDMSVCGESSQQSPQDVRRNERRRT